MTPAAENLSKIFDNDRYTFVPTAVFKEKNKDKYLAVLGLTDEDSVVCADYIKGADAYNVYAITKQEYEALQSLPETTKFHHASSVLVASLIKDNLERTDDVRVYLNIKDQKFEMIDLKGCDLLFNNTFRFKTKEDFLYFLLFTIEQLHLDAGSVPVYFLGMIEEKSAIVEATSRYMRDIRFMGKDYNAQNKVTTCEL